MPHPGTWPGECNHISHHSTITRLAPRPFRRSEVPSRRHLQISRALSISGIQEDSIAPPVRKRISGIADSEEDDDTAQGSAGVESCGEDVVVFCPPCEELRSSGQYLHILVKRGVAGQDFTNLLFDPMVEDEIHHRPAAVVDSCCWRDVVCAHEDERPAFRISLIPDVRMTCVISVLPINFPPVFLLCILPQQPSNHRHDSTNPEEMQKTRIDLSNRIKPSRPNEPPNH